MNAQGKIQDLRIIGISKNLAPTAITIELEGQPYAPIHDNQGNTRRLLDPMNGLVLAKNDFSAFGELLTSSTELMDPWRYGAKRFDPDINLIDYGKRFYCPALGRWMTTDPAGFVDTMNLYAFLRNNPFRYNDPDGQFAFLIPVFAGCFCLGGEITIGLAASEMVAAAAIGATCAYGFNELFKGFEKAGYRYPTLNSAEQSEVKDPKAKSRPRTEPIDLEEQVALEEAKGADGKKVEMEIKDPRYPETDWVKMKHNHKHPDGTCSEVHWWENIHDGTRHGHKFKDLPDNGKSRIYKLEN